MVAHASVIARSKATKQSILSSCGPMDCFAALAMTAVANGQMISAWIRVRGHLRAFSIRLPIAEEIQQRGIEQDWILQEGEMADIGQDQQAGAGNCCGDIFRVLALDAFIMVSIHDQDG